MRGYESLEEKLTALGADARKLEQAAPVLKKAVNDGEFMAAN